MTLAARDKEDVKADLRKRYGSVFAFEDAFGLPRKSVSDTLRGRANKRVSDAITEALAPSTPSDKADDSVGRNPVHRLNASKQ